MRFAIASRCKKSAQDFASCDVGIKKTGWAEQYAKDEEMYGEWNEITRTRRILLAMRHSTFPDADTQYKNLRHAC